MQPLFRVNDVSFVRVVERNRFPLARQHHLSTDLHTRSLILARGNQEEHEATPWALSASTRGFLEARALEKGYEWQMTKFHAKRSAERTGAREKRR